MVPALSMSATLLSGETLTAALVALMHAGGIFLEGFAEGRARREMSDLRSRGPRTETRHHNGSLEAVQYLVRGVAHAGSRVTVVDRGDDCRGHARGDRTCEFLAGRVKKYNLVSMN